MRVVITQPYPQGYYSIDTSDNRNRLNPQKHALVQAVVTTQLYESMAACTRAGVLTADKCARRTRITDCGATDTWFYACM